MSILSLFELAFWVFRMFAGTKVGPEEEIMIKPPSPIEIGKRKVFIVSEEKKKAEIDFGKYFAPVAK